MDFFEQIEINLQSYLKKNYEVIQLGLPEKILQMSLLVVQGN